VGVRSKEPEDGVRYRAGLFLRREVVELREGHGLGVGDRLAS
jgi:hypothetical protein